MDIHDPKNDLRILQNKKKLLSKNVRKFTSLNEAYEYLAEEVFETKDFIRQVKLVAEQNKISYIVAFDVITHYLTDILYEIDENISRPKKRLTIRVYGYFSLKIGWMIQSKREKFKEYKKSKIQEK